MCKAFWGFYAKCIFQMASGSEEIQSGGGGGCLMGVGSVQPEFPKSSKGMQVHKKLEEL